MSKYDALPILLEQEADANGRVRLSFSAIEKFLGFELPASKRYAAWWSNNPTNSVMTKVWLDHGWRTQEVDLRGEELTFVKGARSDESPLNLGGEARDKLVVDLRQLTPIAFKVLTILAKRSGRSIGAEAIAVLDDALGRS